MNDNRKSWHVTPPYLLGIALVVLVVLASAKMLLEVIVAMFGRK